MSLRIEPALRWLQSFLVREWALALPIALAFLGLPPLLVALAMPRIAVVMPRTLPELEAVSAMLPGWFVPAVLLMSLLTVVGALSLAALAVVPRISVREALVIGMRRFPVWLAQSILLSVAMIVVVTFSGALLTMVGIGIAGVYLLMAAIFVIGGCFMVLMVPLVVDRPGGPVTLLVAGWRLYRRWLLKLGGALCLFWLGVWVAAFALQVGVGSLLLVLMRLAGQEALGQALAMVVSSVAAAAHWGIFYLFAASLYRLASGAAASKGM